MSYLPAEWHKQSLIQLTWPHKDTDWAYMLDEVNDCFLKIAYEVLKRQSLLIVAPDPDSIRDSIDNYGADIQKLVTSKINTNDTWARDHAFITLLKEDATPLLLDFCFNGWGMKFAAKAFCRPPVFVPTMCSVGIFIVPSSTLPAAIDSSNISSSTCG